MNTLVVKEIKKSIDIMDEFEGGEYDYLEMQHWFWVRDKEERSLSFNDNAGRFYISLMISKTRNKEKPLCKIEPTMTDLRKMQHHGISLNGQYQKDSIDEIIRQACTKWEKDIFIELPMTICLRAQTSWNRMEYGCEWLGGGDWEEKTLYGETTDFFISGIILREPYKSIAQEAREILESCICKKEENSKLIENIMSNAVECNQNVFHKKYGNGTIENIENGKIRILFSGKNKGVLFIYPDVFLQKYVQITGTDSSNINIAIGCWNENNLLEKDVKRFTYAIEKDDFLEMYRLVDEYKSRH